MYIQEKLKMCNFLLFVQKSVQNLFAKVVQSSCFCHRLSKKEIWFNNFIIRSSESMNRKIHSWTWSEQFNYFSDSAKIKLNPTAYRWFTFLGGSREIVKPVVANLTISHWNLATLKVIIHQTFRCRLALLFYLTNHLAYFFRPRLIDFKITMLLFLA